MATDKKISDLQTVSTLTPTDTSLLVRNGADYQFAFSTLLTYISDSIGAGVSITSGAALPQNNSGNNGDVFIHTSANAIAQKIAGTWTVIYTFPSAGSSGGSVLYGLSTPANTTGNNNDTYINTGTGVFYQKNNNVWNQVFSMQTGPAGPPGTPGTNGTNGTNGQTLLNGSTAPANGLGNNGDFYINTSTGYLYGPKSGGAWPAGVSMEGPQGPSAYQVWISQGNTGTPADFLNSLKGSTGAQGVQGVAGPAGASGAPGAQGAAGAPGPQGEQGATGAAGANGQGVPAGGSAGQILTKNTNTDFDTAWQTPSSGGNAYTLPIATASVVGGVKQGAGVSIAGDGTLSVAGGSGVRGQSGTLPIGNVLSYEAYGDSITGGYNTGSYNAIPFPQLLSVRLGLNQVVQRYYSGTGVWYAAQQANRYIVPGTGDKLISWLCGLNDIRANGDDPRVLSKIQTCLTSFLAGIFVGPELHGLATSGGGSRLTNTGSWTSVDTTAYGGRSAFMLYDAHGRMSTVAGSTLWYDVSNNADTVIIGTFTDDGTPGNALGGFDVYISKGGVDYHYLTYEPTGLNDGLQTSNATAPPTAQGIMPNALIIKGCQLSTVKIVTRSNLPTIIDYFGLLNAPQVCSPVLVGTVPKMTTAQYASSKATLSLSDTVDSIIETVVTQFPGYPVAIFNINSVYDPNIESLDGIHPNYSAHLAIADLLMEYVLGGSKLYIDPSKDQIINGLTIGLGGGGQSNNLGAAFGQQALRRQTTGNNNIAIGGLAGASLTNAHDSVYIGTQAGFSDLNGGNIYIGSNAASNATTGYANVVIGQNAQLVNNNDHDVILISTGEQENIIKMDNISGIQITSTNVPPSVGNGVSSTHKIPFTYNNLKGYLLFSEV